MSRVNSSSTLSQLYGPLMHTRDVQQALRYQSAEAVRVARASGRLKIRMFSLPGRRGLFARTEDVALWLDQAMTPEEEADM